MDSCPSHKAITERSTPAWSRLIAVLWRIMRYRDSSHSTVMHLLQTGVDNTVIALMLVHESPTTTHQYVELDLRMKEQCLHKLQSPKTKLARFKPSDRLLAFLETL